MNNPYEDAANLIKKQKQAKIAKDTEERELKESKNKLSAELKLFVNDKRYIAYKSMLVTLAETKIKQRENLINTLKNKDRYLMTALKLDAEINILKIIIDIPNQFNQES